MPLVCCERLETALPQKVQGQAARGLLHAASTFCPQVHNLCSALKFAGPKTHDRQQLVQRPINLLSVASVYPLGCLSLRCLPPGSDVLLIPALDWYRELTRLISNFSGTKSSLEGGSLIPNAIAVRKVACQ
jgi:hypothetical protein